MGELFNFVSKIARQNHLPPTQSVLKRHKLCASWCWEALVPNHVYSALCTSWYFLSHFLFFSSVQSLSRVWLFATPWTAACQASLSITNFRSPPKPMSIESVTPSNHLILCCPLLLLSSIVPSIRVFSNESALRIRWPKCWSFRTGWISLQSKLKGAFTDAGRFAFTSSCVAVSVHEEEVLKK